MPGDQDQPPAGRGDEQSPVRQREHTPLNGPRLERFGRNQHRPQKLQRPFGSGFILMLHGVRVHGVLCCAISARNSRNLAFTIAAFALPIRIISFCPGERLWSDGSAYSKNTFGCVSWIGPFTSGASSRLSMTCTRRSLKYCPG